MMEVRKSMGGDNALTAHPHVTTKIAVLPCQVYAPITNGGLAALAVVSSADRCDVLTKHEYVGSRRRDSAQLTWDHLFKCRLCGSIRAWGTA